LLTGGPPDITYTDAIIDYVKRTYPKLQYIISDCTGAQILAKAGILDGKRATTNKFLWNQVVASGPAVNWVSVSPSILLPQLSRRYRDSITHVTLIVQLYNHSTGSLCALGGGWKCLDQLRSYVWNGHGVGIPFSNRWARRYNIC
jgi:hypothetical protein